jgi:hypothetical protein
MRIICTKAEESEMARALADVAIANGYETDVKHRQDAYAVMVWSIDDVAVLRDKRVRSMSAYDRERFMDYAERQLKADMTDRAWESLDIQLGLFFDEKKAAATAEAGNDKNGKGADGL